MEILDNDTDEHVEDEETDEENERYEVQQSPFRIIFLRLGKFRGRIISAKTTTASSGPDILFCCVDCLPYGHITCKIDDNLRQTYGKFSRFPNLLIHADSIEPGVHDVHPAVAR